MLKEESEHIHQMELHTIISATSLYFFFNYVFLLSLLQFYDTLFFQYKISTESFIYPENTSVKYILGTNKEKLKVCKSLYIYLSTYVSIFYI